MNDTHCKRNYYNACLLSWMLAFVSVLGTSIFLSAPTSHPAFLNNFVYLALGCTLINLILFYFRIAPFNRFKKQKPVAYPVLIATAMLAVHIIASLFIYIL